ncbi:MAG: glycosyltransferase family 9 protein, partial [Candidatus Edwardsbacteria bacterium]|nr:glycosyltransferase family 9 protein [Candidatus Edwardsbacteria bacterium]
MKNILLVRTDRIGDVVLSLPCAALIKQKIPGARVTFLAREYTAPLARMSPDVDEVLSDDAAERANVLAGKLRRSRFNAAVLLHPKARLALALWLSGIPVRVGTAYRWYSILLNRRIRQHRKYSLKHELEHNLDLVSKGLGLGGTTACGQRSVNAPKIVIPDELKIKALSKLHHSALGIQHSHVPSEVEGYVVIHPGSGGSAMNWPLERFAEMIDRIQNTEYGIPDTRVVVTLGPGEEPIKEKLKRSLKTEPIWVSGLTLPELAGLL